MGTRRKMENRYRRFSYLTDIGGIKSSIGEMKGKGFPKQPRLNTAYTRNSDDPVLNEEWIVDTIKDKLERHPDNGFEYPFYGEKIITYSYTAADCVRRQRPANRVFLKRF